MPFRARIDHNAEIEFLSMSAAAKWQAWKADHKGSEIVIEDVKKGRSLSQNAYYWAYLEIISKECGDNATDLHEVFKRELLPPVFRTIRGKEYRLPGSTRELDKAAFSEYLDKICALTNVPLPNPEEAGYISNYGPMPR
jgi:hypothetical protein